MADFESRTKCPVEFLLAEHFFIEGESMNTQYISTAPAAEQEEKKKKKKLILIIFFIFFSCAAVIGVIVGVVLGTKKPASNLLSVTIDPIIVNNASETHIEGAEKFTLDLTNGSKDFTKDLNVQLSGEEYFKYSIEIENDETDKIYFFISLSNLENNGFAITYKIGGEELAFPAEGEVKGEIAKGQKQKIEILFKMSDSELESGKVAGKLTFSASMVEEIDE